MDAHWVHDRPGYRCRHGHSSARSADAARPKNLYVREDHALAKLAELQADLGRGGSTPEDLARRLRHNRLARPTAPAGASNPQRSRGRMPQKPIRSRCE
jgi:hypothetical protein